MEQLSRLLELERIRSYPVNLATIHSNYLLFLRHSRNTSSATSFCITSYSPGSGSALFPGRKNLPTTPRKLSSKSFCIHYKKQRQVSTGIGYSLESRPLLSACLQVRSSSVLKSSILTHMLGGKRRVTYESCDEYDTASARR